MLPAPWVARRPVKAAQLPLEAPEKSVSFKRSTGHPETGGGLCLVSVKQTNQGATKDTRCSNQSLPSRSKGHPPKTRTFAPGHKGLFFVTLQDLMGWDWSFASAVVPQASHRVRPLAYCRPVTDTCLGHAACLHSIPKSGPYLRCSIRPRGL